MLDRQLQMEPGEIRTGFRDLRQPIGAQVNHRHRQHHGAQFRHQFLPVFSHGLLTDDQRQPIMRFALLETPKLRKVMEVDRFEVQESQQGHQIPALRI